MKTFILSFVTLLLMCSSSFSQGSGKCHGDSLWLEDGNYYAPRDYPAAKKAYENKNFETWFMPGLSYAYYAPKRSDSLGTYQGVAVEYLIYGQVRQNDKPGPSHVRVYTKLNILKSQNTENNSLLMYAAGLDLSLEKNPKRTFMIPYFGLEFGGMTKPKTSATAQFTPTIGIHLLSRKNLFLNVQGGYVYPINNFETMQGWTTQIGFNAALW